MHVMVARLAARGIQTEEPGIAQRLRGLLDGMGHRPGRLPHRARPVARRASRRHDAVRPDGSGAEPMTGSHPRSARDVVEELFRRQKGGRRHGPGRPRGHRHGQPRRRPAGPRWSADRSCAPSRSTSGRSELEQHHLIGEGDLVVQHVTLHGTHRASTMPLLADVPVTGRSAAWTFIHIWRVADGMLVEHWACRDDMGLLEQLRPS